MSCNVTKGSELLCHRCFTLMQRDGGAMLISSGDVSERGAVEDDRFCAFHSTTLMATS